MPDITMCVTKTCPIREGCFRYTAKPNNYQSYSDFSHLVTIGLNGYECEKFSPVYKTLYSLGGTSK